MRTEGSSRDRTWPIIRKAGIKLLYKYGFHGMNLRRLAADSNLQAGSLYNYFKNKDEFLSIIVCDIMNELLNDIEEALGGVDDPEERLRKFIEVMVIWHTKRKTEAVVSQAEIRSLPKGQYRELVGMRKRFELILRDIVDDGVRAGVFHVSDAKVTVIMILNMLISIANWYKPNGRLSPEELLAQYIDVVFHILDHRAAYASPRREEAVGA